MLAGWLSGWLSVVCLAAYRISDFLAGNMLAVIKLVLWATQCVSCNLPTAVEQIAHYAYAALCLFVRICCFCCFDCCCCCCWVCYMCVLLRGSVFGNCLCHLGKYKHQSKHHLTTEKACLPPSVCCLSKFKALSSATDSLWQNTNKKVLIVYFLANIKQ